MPTRLRTMLLALAVVPLILALAAGWHLLQKPRALRVGPLLVDRSPERVARGEYLVKHVAACFHCHSEVDAGRMGQPPRPGLEGRGRVLPPSDQAETRRRLVAGNLTADERSGLGGWTDDEIVRAIREGVGRDGRALNPLMPYGAYRSLADDDAQAVVAYLRTLPPAASDLPSTKLSARDRLDISGIPEPLVSAVPPPDPEDPLARGLYLATISGCVSCHSPVDGELSPPLFALVHRMSRETFIRRFRAVGGFPAGQEPMVSPALNAAMPWTALGGMIEEDLGAIHDYLLTMSPADSD